MAFHRRLSLGEPLRKTLRVSLAMQPTLVFTLVVAGILRERLDAPPWVFGGLIVYTIVNTLIPGFALHAAPPEFENPHVLPAELPASTGESPAARDSTAVRPGP
ncbi:MAG: hypothetical protein A2W00_15150 [Candidatus Eisenbacteria bacterium RBG_16_71_46]|nr:MAG: hypothetical protein A2W00_15150 [Candidatus Eisenbacteria bacterium RBG_16_71_46]